MPPRVGGAPWAGVRRFGVGGQGRPPEAPIVRLVVAHGWNIDEEARLRGGLPLVRRARVVGLERRWPAGGRGLAEHTVGS